MTDVITLMKHIDYIYEPIPNIYSNKEYIVQLKNNNWMIFDGERIVLGTTDSDVALGFLQEMKIDMVILHSLLIDKVATEGVLRRMQLKKCEDLIGADIIDEQAKGFDAMVKNIIDAVGIKEDKPKLQIVK